MKKHYRNIDFLKGICIIIVIFEHAGWSRETWLKGLFPFWDRIAIPMFMVISGFVYTLSLQRKGMENYYSFHELSHKLKRYLRPYIIAFSIENVAYLIIANKAFRRFIENHFHFPINSIFSERVTILNSLKSFISGGYGPGNYYTPVLIQLIILFPLLYILIKTLKYKGLFLSGILCFAFELCQYFFKIPNSIYRCLIFRHLITICFGIYLALKLYTKNTILNLLSLLIGLTYIVAHSYFQFTPGFFNSNWADVNFIACLFYCPIIAFLIKKEKLHFRPIEQIGKASYHIYLTQMVYYNFFKKTFIIKLINNSYLWCLVSMIICAIFGLCFYHLEKKIISYKPSS